MRAAMTNDVVCLIERYVTSFRCTLGANCLKNVSICWDHMRHINTHNDEIRTFADVAHPNPLKMTMDHVEPKGRTI